MQVFQKLFGKQPWAQSLVARVRLSSRYSSEEQSLVFKHNYGIISDLGFAECGSFEIIHHAPEAEPVVNGQFYQDKNVVVSAGGTQNALGRAEVKEDYVYDFHYRCDIDFTGLKIDLTLRQSAFEEYREFIGTVRHPADLLDPTAWHGDLLISIPGPKFDFPRGRGSAPPYPPGGATVRKLRTIKAFHFDELDIIKSRPMHERIPVGTEIATATPENVLSLR